ncbi:sulfide dehydrogenase (flavocytochrome c), flavoprotein subunit [Sulfurivirga caldicuralii]|uniref:Sulfide dehydrogenase (Flavocytochrome c), flavoprotein subunit n=1 Tax=Sulfurivirga caldicuralii TaxID=364032 RepID=A0A1N6DT74_9GAMM|nr:NAD(P)/FAD-dependent oxidoreductase [Sulfurivirga caldicuralii]SIN73894.1 sulfide dehydrogenase (flavocytochrome c), flavoprotein subunit [Sulfurivirga caldicuralii]
MSIKFTRRNFIRTASVTAALPAGALLTSAHAMTSVQGTAQPHVVVIGGGFGGATCAKYLRRYDSNIRVTLIEPKKTYTTCPGSNWYLAGLTDFDSITHSYQALKDKHGINVVHEWVSGIDPAGKTVKLKNGETLQYDRLVVSPGIDFRWDTIEGYGPEDVDKVPHAWQAGPQTKLLYDQLRAMPNGGTYIICPPPNPFRCPPGPYERVSMVADYFKKHKPKSKIIILDAKDKFSKMPLFMQGWQDLYGDMIEWIGASDGGRIKSVDVASKTVTTAEGETFKADVLNVIPAQKAGKLAFDAGLTNESGWCPVHQNTFESTIHKGVYVIGDSSIAGKMPKSGHSANSQGKICAAAIAVDLNGWDMPRPKLANTCYSLVANDYGISVVAVYQFDGKVMNKVKGAGGVTPKGAAPSQYLAEATYARGWYKSITHDTWLG